MKRFFTTSVIVILCLNATYSQILSYVEWGAKSDPDGTVDTWINEDVTLFNYTKFGINYIQFKSSDLDVTDQSGFIVFPSKDSREAGVNLKADIEICCKVDGVWSGDFDLLMTANYSGDPRTTTWTTVSANMLNGKSDWSSADWNMRLMTDIEFENPNYQGVVFAIKVHDTKSNNKTARIYSVNIYDPLATTVDNSIFTETRIYPNPVVDFITIEGYPEGSNVSICSITGNCVGQASALINGQLDVSFLQAGHYFLVIEKDGVKKVEKFLKK